MEHIATVMSKDPVEVRLANMAGDDNPLPQMIEYWKQHTDYVNRFENIKKFNEVCTSVFKLTLILDYDNKYYLQVPLVG